MICTDGNRICKKKGINKLIIFMLVLSVALVTVTTASAQKEFLPPNHGFSVNYYNSYGEPDIYASVLGNPEFEKGSIGEVKITLANKGVLYAFKPDTTVGDDEDYEHSLSLKELEYETMRTTATGIKATLKSPTGYIEIDPTTSSHTIEELFPGELSESPLSFKIKVSKTAPAGDYLLQLPISYEYQSEVEMTNGDLIRLGLNDLDHITQYKTVNKTLTIPISIKESANFEVTDVSGDLTAGSTSLINITYKNIGEIPASDAIARLVVMRPLSIEKSTALLETIEPGESKTVSFKVSADTGAVPKNYGIDSEIKYLDEDGEMELSDNLKISIPLDASSEGISLGTFSIAGIIILVIYLIAKNTLKRKN